MSPFSFNLFFFTWIKQIIFSYLLIFITSVKITLHSFLHRFSYMNL